MLRERGLMSSRILFLHDNSLTVPLPGKRERLYLALHISEYLLLSWFDYFMLFYVRQRASILVDLHW